MSFELKTNYNQMAPLSSDGGHIMKYASIGKQKILGKKKDY